LPGFGIRLGEERGIFDGLHLLQVKLSNNTTSTVTKMKKLPSKTLRGWEAQMNCHADAPYATEYLDNWSDPTKIVPFIPASKASIFIAGVTIIRNVARRLAASPAALP
jgi:hypothetical protein